MKVNFPPPAAVVDDYVDRPAFREEFWKATERLRTRTVKVEWGQTFQEPGNPSWEAFAAGDFRKAIHLIEQNRQDHIRQQRVFDDTGTPFYRIRVIRFPLSDYLKWELAHFRLNAELGERIFLAESARIADIELEGGLDDFTLFDEFLMLATEYTEDGVFKGAHIVRDQRYLSQVSDLADKLLDRSLPYEEFPLEKYVPELEG
ncbi:hypothetical protein SAMN05421504_104341 [Amycolatopsis xylanica]|uniref:DUF6879 domain-containing protein n=1 Tax=Amycolatopsis xylanica TaxID=589385 RepID=A0A1H3GPT7_9PSEU|nr:DUF6879 family protein [Amycolatopsis xylanica]SDY04985.1 hypothetical protein SAMN05421504_104341 [Amycolatopsis xylanica]